MEVVDKIKDRIMKLLILASDNKNETETFNALAKARQLMAEYKLEDVEFNINKNNNILPTQKVLKLNFKKMYMLSLTILIEKYFPVEFLYTTNGNYRSCTMYGTKEDIEIAESFLYSVDRFINKEVARIRARANRNKITQRAKGLSRTKNLKNSYYYGFLEGLDEKLDMQNKSESEEFSLVLQTPKVVKEYCNNIANGSIEFSSAEKNERNSININFYNKGYKDGLEFTTNILAN